MLRIAHTADVHWRGLSRHDEYREIFSAFINDCKKSRVDHIFIGGDIFHTKTSGISPEYINQLTWWLNAMSEVAVVHIILGNHDGNLTNLSRQDAVSPIVDAMKNDRIKLYKKSGTYEFSPGYNWCVFSLFDEEGWKDVKPVPGMINIACFHGSVRGCVTETGWDITEGISTDFFNEYDFVFLGDIHKRQMLAYRDGKPWIGFPGTPIQQNYAEELDHGYLLWDIGSASNWDVKFCQLPNVKPYVTIDWQENHEKLINEALLYPKQSRFRIRSNVPMSQGDIQTISNQLKTTFQATEVTFKTDCKVETKKISTSDVVIEKSDIRSNEVILSLLRSYAKENKYSNVNWEAVENDVKKYLSLVTTTDDLARGSSWSLKQLKWDNIFAYGEGNEIDFSNLNGIVGIFGPNRIGKSSIIGTIMYSLFNTTDRGSMKNIYVCNVRKPYCSSRAIFEHNGKSYVVERQTTKQLNKKGGVSASTALNLFKINDDEAEDLGGEQRTDTEKIIRSLLGSPDDFLLTSFSAQGETNAFIALSSAKRRSLLSRFLDLDVFDKMYENCNKELNGFKARLKNYPEKDWDALKKQGEDLCIDLQKKIEDLQIKISDTQNLLTDVKYKLSLHKDLKPVTKIQLEAQEKKVSSLEKQAQECSSYIDSLKAEISSLTSKLETVNSFIESEDIDELKTKLTAIDSIEKSITSLKHSYELETATLKQQQKSLALLDEVPCGDEYPTCKFIKDAHLDKSKFQNQKEKEANIKASLDKAINSLNLLDKNSIISKISKYEKAVGLLSNIKLEISKKETEIEKCKSSCEICLENLKEAKTKLVDIQKALKNNENYEVVALRSKLEELSSIARDHDDEKIRLATQHGRALSDLEKLKSEKDSRESLIREMKSTEMICDAFSKKGLPLMITKTQLPVINQEISKILQGIVDFTVELENDDETDSTEIYINYGDSRRIIELCSGMEKTISSIAIRVALVNISTLPKLDMFIIDEGFGTLDESGVEACSRLLNSLKRYFKTILMITHVDGIKDMADHIIEITKQEKDSKVVVT